LFLNSCEKLRRRFFGVVGDGGVGDDDDDDDGTSVHEIYSTNHRCQSKKQIFKDKLFEELTYTPGNVKSFRSSICCGTFDM